MKLKIIIPFIAFVIASCHVKEKETETFEPTVNPDYVLSNSMNFIAYWSGVLNLSEDFKSLDTTGKEMPKEDFLTLVSTGNYLPLRLNPTKEPRYILYKVKPEVNSEVKDLIKMVGEEETAATQWEGRPLPDINYKSVSGKIYNPTSIKEKWLVINFWFIGCQPCVAEIPELNEIADEQKERSDVEFMAIAFDPEKNLHDFLKKKEFKYDVISDTSSYLGNKLGINSFPSHVIVDKNGKVIKILNDQYHNLENLKQMVAELANP